MQELLTRLEADADLVLIDAPPLLPVTDAAILATLASGAIMVVRAGKTSRDQAAGRWRCCAVLTRTSAAW